MQASKGLPFTRTTVRPFEEIENCEREYLRWWVEKSRKEKQIREYQTARNEALTVAEAVRKELEKQLRN